MKPTYATENLTLYQGDCLDVLDDLEPNSIDTIICDPPYALAFMGRKWDSFAEGTGQNSFYSFCSEWAAKCLRVAKPGAYILSFGGSRTFHRLMCAIEDAGWKLCDTLMYCYGSGFPKGINISKAIDKRLGEESKVVGSKAGLPGYSLAPNLDTGGLGRSWRGNDADMECAITEPATDTAKLWDGWNSTLKPAWEPIILAMKPLDGTFAENAIHHGVAGLHIDACRIEYRGESDKASATPQGKCTSKEVSAIGAEPDAGRDLERVGFTRPELKGRWPTNILLEHHAECVQDGTRKVKGTKPHEVYSKVEEYEGWGNINQKKGEVVNRFEDADGYETIEKWECHPECPVRLLDEQSGILKSGSNCVLRKSSKGYTPNALGKESRPEGAVMISYGDMGGASRFFYTSKASPSERNAGLTSGKNTHPTVKPLGLMEYLCKLTSTPSGGVVLDTFMGSGTTGWACINTNRKFIGVERDEKYYQMAQERLIHFAAQKKREKKKFPFE